jgi:type I restriction enzyme R subunit
VDAQGVELLTKQINITDRKELEEAVGSLGSDKSKAEAIAALTEKTINDKMQTDPEFYQRFSDKVSDILKKMREGKMADIEALKNLKEISESVLTKQDDTIPKEIEEVTGADVFFRNLSPVFTTKGTSPEKQITITLAIFELLKKEAIVDWHKNAEVKRVMKNKIDDYLYDTVKGEMDIELSNDDTHSLVEDVMLLAEHNHELFKA